MDTRENVFFISLGLETFRIGLMFSNYFILYTIFMLRWKKNEHQSQLFDGNAHKKYDNYYNIENHSQTPHFVCCVTLS